ncbi:MAG: translation initiation factor IF-3 [Bacilli bacterium]|nr:translation initiation factor IF-3 [Bacilli bacterium]
MYYKEDTLIYPQDQRPLPKKGPKELVNEDIPFSQILVIGADGQKIGVMSKREGLKLADEQNLDLFCIAPNGKPPVCKIMNYSKFKFDKKKQERENRAKQARPDLIKEIKITPVTSQHDIETKVNQSVKLLAKGWRLKLTVFLKGRMITRADSAAEALNTMIELLKNDGVVDKQPTLEGRQYFCYMSPIKKK